MSITLTATRLQSLIEQHQAAKSPEPVAQPEHKAMIVWIDAESGERKRTLWVWHSEIESLMSRVKLWGRPIYLVRAFDHRIWAPSGR